MSLTPGVPQRFEKDRLAYPGMQPEETLVWRAWLALFEQNYEAFDYNTRIGAGDVPPNVTNEATVRDAILNSKLRLDAVGWHDLGGWFNDRGTYPPAEVYAARPTARATLIEVKRRAATAAGTEIITYYHLWQHEFPNAPPPAMLIVANTYSQTVKPAWDRQGIALEIVTVDFSSLRPRFRKGQ